MIKVCGWQQGEFGDIILSSTLCRTFKELNPDSFLTLAVNKKYSNVLPLFYNNEFVDGFHLWDEYDKWPGEKDYKFIKKLDYIYSAMPKHKNNFWYKQGIHQIDEIHDMYDFQPPKNKQCYLNRWFDLLPGYNKTITASIFASGFHPDQLARTFNLEKIEELFRSIEGLGFNIIRLDTKHSESSLEDYWPASELSFINASKLMLSSRLHLTCDTSWSWIADAYSHNTIGWTRSESYVPVNPNGHYFVSENINNIPIDQILELIKQKI